jgi:hypothetical protein
MDLSQMTTMGLERKGDAETNDWLMMVNDG